MATRKNIRLPRHSYIGRGFHFLTLCCNHRRSIFADRHRCQRLL